MRLTCISLLACLSLLILAMTSCTKELVVAPSMPQPIPPARLLEYNSGISESAPIEVVRASLQHRVNIKTYLQTYRGLITQYSEVRDASGELVTKANHGGFSLDEFANVVQVPGHCYYALFTYVNATTGELLDQVIYGEHCIPPNVSPNKQNKE